MAPASSSTALQVSFHNHTAAPLALSTFITNQAAPLASAAAHDGPPSSDASGVVIVEQGKAGSLSVTDLWKKKSRTQVVVALVRSDGEKGACADPASASCFPLKITKRVTRRVLELGDGREGRVVIYQERITSNHVKFTAYTSPNPADWMAGLPNDEQLAHLYLPGTHESLAIHGWPISSCQTFPVRSQLESGVRFLDYRWILHRDGSLKAYHGIQNQYLSAERAIGFVYDFLEKHPTETVVVSVKQENDIRGFEQATWHLLNKRREMWYTEDRWPRLGEVRGKCVMFCRFGHNSRQGLHPAYWPDNSPTPWGSVIGEHPVVVQDWYSIGSFVSIPEKAALVLSLFRPQNSPPTTSSPLRINFASGATLITAFPFVVAKGVGVSRFGIKGVNERVLQGLLKLGRESKVPGDGGMILILDYYEVPGGLYELLIAWNFNT